MTIIVTGGAGFIGSNFVYLQLKEHPEDRIICLDKLTYAGNLSTLQEAMEHPNFRFVKADIADRAAVEQLFEQEHPDIVVNFAAESLFAYQYFGYAGADGCLPQVRDSALPPGFYGRSVRRSAAGSSRPVFYRRHTDTHKQSLQFLKSRSRSACFGILPHLWPAGIHRQMLQHLRPLPLPGNAAPADDQPGAGGRGTAG